MSGSDHNNKKLSSEQEVRLNGLLTKYGTGKLSAKEKAELKEILSGSAEHRQVLELLEGNSIYGPGMVRMYSYDEERVWNAILRADARNKRRRHLWRTYGIVAAASIALAVILSVYFTVGAGQKPIDNMLATEIVPGSKMAYLQLSGGDVYEISDGAHEQITEADHTSISISPQEMKLEALPGADSVHDPVMLSIHVPKGGESPPTVLSDGTKIWVNSASSITFPTKFTGDTREVAITGEVYFEVKADSARPFIVKAGEQVVTVLGTSFNISAYDDDPTVETTLVSGKLRVDYKGFEHTLEPGRQACIDKAAEKITVRDVVAESYMLWVRGEFFFRDEPIESICRKFSRWYGVDFVVDESVKDLLYTGVLRRYDTFNKIAGLMIKTGDFYVKEEDGKIRIHPQNR